MSKVRITDLSRELEVKSKAILDVLPLIGVTEKKFHASSLEEHEAEKVRTYIRGSAEAQTPAAKSIRPLRGEEIIKTKIDLSHISRPSDVLKAITKHKQQSETTALPSNARVTQQPQTTIETKPALKEDSEKRDKTLAQLNEGAIVTGVVKEVTDYGALIEVGGLEGRLYLDDMSWVPPSHPGDFVKVGERIRVKILQVLNFANGERRLSLGFKQLTRDPFLDAAERYPVGAHVTGRVISVTDYGAFIGLEPGVIALAHVSEFTWSSTMKHPSKIVKIGEQVQAVVLHVNSTDRRISLSMRQLTPPPKPVPQVAAPVLPPAKRNIPTAPNVATPEDFDYHTLLEWAASLEKLRVLLIRLLEEIEPLPTGVDMKPGRRLGDLVRDGKIPRTIDPMFKTLIELRNDNQYKCNVPGPNEIAVITANLAVIVAWGVKNHLKTASALRLWTPPDCS